MTNNIKSMTGYGKSVVEFHNKKIGVEIKTLNSKQFDLNLKLPVSYKEKEFEIRSILSKALERGKTDVFITVETTDCAQVASINKELFEQYYRQIVELNCEQSNCDYVSAILRLPEVISIDKQEITEEEFEALYRAVTQAVAAADAFRLHEGAILMTDILNRIDTIEKLSLEVEKYEPQRTEAIRARIRESAEKLNITLDANRLEQEMIFYIEKLDITEEKVRLKKHLDYFREVCRKEESVGKKLGFVSQEIGREINTLGSKSNHSDMQQLVVGMKDELEKIKEQLLNIL